MTSSYMSLYSLLVVIFVGVCLSCAKTTEKNDKYSSDYCVLGAGPSGLQMGYFLKKAGRDYVIFERSNSSGAFYTKYPRHGKLISINKRHTGKTNKEFNLRHDWNSLISDDESLQMRYYSKEFFPPRETFVKYLNDYEKKLGLFVQHNTDISNISRHVNPDTNDISFTMNDQRGTSYTCKTLIVATGISVPNIPQFKGVELADTYDSVSINPEDYEGKSVLIIGRGNSAFEMADSIMGSTNVIHMMARSRVRLSWETHYVGDLRAINNGLLDTYQLKSLDGVIEASVENALLVSRNGKIWLELADKDDDDDNVDSDNSEKVNEAYNIDNFALRDPYDKVILCTGFKFDTSVFANDTMPEMGTKRKSKYPRINFVYESMKQKGMFFIGTNSHSIDHRKSAGGFIHGFRYTTRVVHHVLEWKNHQIPWPATRLPISELLNTLLKRINEASGIYQMFQVLGDAIIIDENGLEFEYMEEVPVHRIYDVQFYDTFGRNATKLIMLVLEYGPDFSGPGKDIFRVDRATGEPSEAHQSNFLHPVLYYYEKLPTVNDIKVKPKDIFLPVPTRIHHVVEDFLTAWDGAISHILPLRRFLEDSLGKDLRHFFAEQCFTKAMTNKDIPQSCQEGYLKGNGLPGTEALLAEARETGLME